MSFPARFRGQCADCDERFAEGTEIRYGPGRSVIHAACPEPALSAVDLRPGDKVCPTCHLVHPGEC